MGARVAVLLRLGSVGRRVLPFDEPIDLADVGVQGDVFDADRGHALRLAPKLPDVRGRDVLELGCGYGGMLSVLAESGARAFGIDVDERRVLRARERGLEATVADAEALPYPDESFDLVVSHAVLEHIPRIGVALAEVRRVLRPGGVFWSVWGPSWLSYNGPHLIKCLGVPWVQLVFSDRTILAALERQKREGVFPASYIDYKIEDFQTMGRTSRRTLRRAAREAGLEVVEESSRSSRRWKNVLGRLPVFGELLPGELTAVLRRPDA